MSDSEKVTITVLDKDYQVNCPADEKSALIDSAVQLDERMREIRDQTKVRGLDRIAVMAALNTTYELMQIDEKQTRVSEGAQEKVVRLTTKIDDALHFCRQLEI